MSTRSAARRVYDTDVICKNLVKHLDNGSLRSFMMLEKQRDIFDLCVKELYREVSHDVVHNMDRGNERKQKYLDAVQVIDGNTSYQSPFKRDIMSYTERMDRDRQLCHPQSVARVRLKCPNVRLIKRHKPPIGAERYTIILQPAQMSGQLRIHTLITCDAFRMRSADVPEYTQVQPEWTALGWSVKQTAGLVFDRLGGLTAQGTSTQMDILTNVDALDKRFIEINTAFFTVPLSVLIDIVKSRQDGRNRISRLTAAVEPFSLDDLRTLIAWAGSDLIELDLSIRGGAVSRLTPSDLPGLVRLVRKDCPRLTCLKLPMTAALGGVRFTDEDIDRPPLDLDFRGGKLRDFGLYMYRAKLESRPTESDAALEQLFSFNAARNVACLTAPGVGCTLYSGERFRNTTFDASIALHGYSRWLVVFNRAVNYFHRLGPILEPHFRSSLSYMGVKGLPDLHALQYCPDGTPVPNSVTPSRKRTWAEMRSNEDLGSYFYDGDDCAHHTSAESSCGTQ